MKRGWQWPVLITLALAFTVGVNVVMLLAAGSDPNGTVVEPDYYRKAVEWDRTMERRAASAALGWTATATLGAIDVTAQAPPATGASVAAGDGTRVLTVDLRDASGAAITDAEVSATLIHNREAATPIALTLRAAGGGRYVVDGALVHAGQWELRVVARRGDARFETSLRVEAP